MNERIENILRNAPGVKTPAGLADILRADIALPRAVAVENTGDFWSGVRRWFPGFATAALFLTCLVALGVQQRVLSNLRQEQTQLASAAAEAQQVAEAKRAERERGRLEAEQLARLQKDNAELQQLRAEVAQLREHLQQLPALRAERERLAAQAKEMESQGAAADSDPFAVAQDKAHRIQCVSNMKQIGLAARMWARDHNEIMPSDFLTMQNELNGPRILVCPAETNRVVAKGWPEFNGSSYVILSPGIAEKRPDAVYAHCAIHNNAGLCDGSVHQLRSNQPIVKDETGHWIVKRP
jgi:flagellar motility protein MotE (MotC chaperone)